MWIRLTLQSGSLGRPHENIMLLFPLVRRCLIFTLLRLSCSILLSVWRFVWDLLRAGCQRWHPVGEPIQDQRSRAGERVLKRRTEERIKIFFGGSDSGVFVGSVMTWGDSNYSVLKSCVTLLDLIGNYCTQHRFWEGQLLQQLYRKKFWWIWCWFTYSGEKNNS